MSIILYHTNTPIPNHLKDCITKIKQYSNIPIYLLTDSSYERDGVVTINTNNYSEFRWLKDLNYFNKDDHMWRGSSFRLFYIKRLMEEKNLSNVLTFDNDVLLYENPEKIIELMSSKYSGFAITAHSHDEVVMGMTFIKDVQAITEVTNLFKQEYALPPQTLKNKYQGYPTEMRILGVYSGCQLLPILPTGISTERYTNNFNHFNSVFDPSSYGQYIGGLPAIHDPQSKPGWFSVGQEIGKKLKENSIQVIMENNNPFVIYNGNKIKINNLHIHSKLTGKFI
jgi:hypothetical protein